MTKKSNPRNIRRDSSGWGVTVVFGDPSNYATTVRRYSYRTRSQARQSDIGHTIGEAGRVA